MESLEHFVKRFCSSVRCYSHPNPSTTNQYSLKKYDSDRHLHMGVFGWVRELKRKGIFEVSSYEDLGDKRGVSHLADLVKPRYQYGRPGILFYIKPDSEGEDYKKTVNALKAILTLK